MSLYRAIFKATNMSASAKRTTRNFTNFSSLPPELRLKVWEEALPANGIHIFDVCLPSSSSHRHHQSTDRSRRAFETTHGGKIRNEAMYDKYKDTVFLDALDTKSDSSTYRHVERVRASCIDGRTTSDRALIPRRNIKQDKDEDTDNKDVNSVYLPGRDKWIHYDNSSDVLFLRFPRRNACVTESHVAATTTDQCSNEHINSISQLLQATWSEETAETIRNARRIALDASELWAEHTSPVEMLEEMAFLACCVQQGLEALYLVDHCIGRCKHCGDLQHLKPGDLQTKGGLHHELDAACSPMSTSKRRNSDVFHGVGSTYREIFDFERLGWTDCHPTYGMAQIMNELIRGQQEDDGNLVFQGVRILVCDDDDDDDDDNVKVEVPPCRVGALSKL